MAVQGEEYIHKTYHAMKKHPQYRTVLTTLLKYEIHLLLQQLSDAGEESLLLTVGVTDGSLCLLGSHGGEAFLSSVSTVQAMVNKVQEEFLNFCNTKCNGEREETESIILTPGSPDQPTSSSSTMSQTPDSFSSHKPVSKETDSYSSSLCQNGNQSDSSVDDSVSALVQNIMKCAKEKETQTMIREMQGRKSQSRRELYTSCSPSVSTSGNMKLSLKKCLNQNVDEAEKSVEETVSQLVQNIMKESEEKEKLNMRQSWYNYRRKRRWSPWQRQTALSPEMDSSAVTFKPRRGRRRKTIAECFPCLTPHKPLELLSNSSSNQSVVVKAELEDYSEYGPMSPRLDRENRHTVTSDGGTVGIDLSKEQAAVGTSCHGDDDKNGPARVETVDGERKGTGDIEDVTVKIEMDEDEVELPFVEEYYKNRGEVNGPDLWTTMDTQDQQDSDDVKFVLRRVSKSNLVHNGFSYIRDKVGKGETVYWKCGRFGCKGRVIQRGAEKIRTQDHNHSPVLQFEDSTSAPEEV